jgi:hypothetical protein
MANADTPRGLWPINNLNGSSYNGATVKVALEDENSTATFLGDPVVLRGLSLTDNDGYSYPIVRQAAASEEIFGVITSFEPDRTNLETKHRLASTTRYAYVVPAVQGQLFAIQCSGAFADEDFGNTADITVGSGNTTTGLSGVELDSSSIATTKVGLQIIGIVNRPDNSIGTNADVIVRVNEHPFGGDGTGVDDDT